jgi:hypothetical protein
VKTERRFTLKNHTALSKVKNDTELFAKLQDKMGSTGMNRIKIAESTSKNTYLIFLLSKAAVMIVTLRIWFHRHRGKEILQSVISKIVGHITKAEQMSETISRSQRVSVTMT